MKSWLASKIPRLQLVESMTWKEATDTSNVSWLHSVLVSLDMTAGKFFRGLRGRSEPTLTISCRLAYSFTVYQTDKYPAGNLDASWGMLMLGAALEWLDPGHMQSAIRADYARGWRAMKYLSARPQTP